MYFAALKIMLNVNMEEFIVGSQILSFIVAAVPPDLAIYVTVAYSWCLFRLKRRGIVSTMLEKTVEANRLKTMCFDKTGTITEN